jgi:hypothetical protein
MPAPRHVPPPAEYRLLSRWLPAPAQRARALGVSRHLVDCADQGRPLRAGALPARRVRRLRLALTALEARGHDAHGAGAVMLATGTHGRRNADELRRRGLACLTDIA